jgi:hypothetical protein
MLSAYVRIVASHSWQANTQKLSVVASNALPTGGGTNKG